MAFAKVNQKDWDDYSLASSVNSEAIKVTSYRMVAFDFISASATRVGWFNLQGSFDNSTWFDIPTSEIAVVASTDLADQLLLNPDDLGGIKYVRVAWTRTAGTGAADVRYFGTPKGGQ